MELNQVTVPCVDYDESVAFYTRLGLKQIVEDAKTAVLGVEGVDDAHVQLTFDPPWTPERMSPLIRASLGL